MRPLCKSPSWTSVAFYEKDAKSQEYTIKVHNLYPEVKERANIDNRIVQGIWVGDPLSDRELLCISSYLSNGHEFHLYTYDKHENLPAGTVIKDANEFLPEKEIETFRYKANFCDYFRYAMLYKRGGWYVDMDSVCLRPLNFSSEYVFGTCGVDIAGINPVDLSCNGAECYIGNAFIKVPVNSPIIAFCRDILSQTRGEERRQESYDELGPRLFQKAVTKFNLQRYVQSPSIFDPVPCFKATHILNPELSWDLRDTYVVHLNGAQWNEKYNNGVLKREGKYPDGCLYEHLKKRYHV